MYKPSFRPTHCFFLILQKATISHVSPDSLYLFRVQAVCRNDMRSDFSQTMLFQGKTISLLVWPGVPLSLSFFMLCLFPVEVLGQKKTNLV